MNYLHKDLKHWAAGATPELHSVGCAARHNGDILRVALRFALRHNLALNKGWLKSGVPIGSPGIRLVDRP